MPKLMHEMRLAVIPFYGDDTHPMVMPYCTGCGWVGARRYTYFTAESVPAEWRTHVEEYRRAVEE